MKNKFAVAAIVLTIAAGLAGCQGDRVSLSAMQKKTADYAALSYGQQAGLDSLGCSGLDSDGDGYVTCNMKTREASPKQSPIVCSYEGEAGGCKPK